MNSKRTSKVKNMILFVVVIAFLIAIIGQTYSRYVSRGNVNTSSQVAKWNIKVNGEDIASQTFELTAVDSEPNENVKEGALAPGKELVASLEVNPAGSEVAVAYSLGIGDLVLGNNFDTDSSIEVTKVVATVDGGSPFEVALDNNVYTYFESLEDVLANKKVTFNVYVGWVNQDTDEGDAADTANVANLTQITAPITITAKQHMGEIIQANATTGLITTASSLNPGDRLVLSEDITYDDYTQYPTSGWKRVEFPVSAIFDLNGNEVTVPNGALAYVGDNLTIKNGTFTGLISSAGGRYGMHLWNDNAQSPDVSKGVLVENVTTTGICLYNTEVTLRNVTVTMPDDAKYYTVYGNVYSTITIESGTYTAGNNTTALFGYCLSDSSEAGVVTPDGKNPTNGFVIKGGTFISKNKPLYLNNSTHGAPIIQGGSFDKDVTSLIDTTVYQCTLNPTTNLYDVTLK